MVTHRMAGLRRGLSQQRVLGVLDEVLSNLSKEEQPGHEPEPVESHGFRWP